MTASEPHRLARVLRALVVYGTLAGLAGIALELVAVAFRLGPRIGIRSAVAVAGPLLVGGYVSVYHAGALRWLRGWPAALRFALSLAAGALLGLTLRSYLVLYPILVVELGVASCLALLAFASGAVPGLARDDHPPAPRSWPLAPFCGVLAGLIGYAVLFGVPRIIPG
jgi:uncharacterized membrane protein YfcA